MADVYVKSGSGALPFNNDVVATARAYTLGERMVPRRADATANNAIAKAWVWEVTTEGTSGTTDPTWPATVTQDVTTVTSGTVVFTARKPGFSSGTTANWSFATIYLDYGMLAALAGDNVFVSNLHSETYPSTSYTITAKTSTSAIVAPVNVLCVSDTVAPPTQTTTGAVITTQNSFNITVQGVIRIVGINLQCGTGNNTTSLSIFGSGVGTNVYTSVIENCILRNNQTFNSGGNISFGDAGNTGQPTKTVLRNVTFGVSNTQLFPIAGGAFELDILGGTLVGSAVTTIASIGGNNRGAMLRVSGVDLSAAAQSANLCNLVGASKAIFRNCKLPSNWTGDVTSGFPINPTARVEMHNCDSGPTNYKLRIKNCAGLINHETNIARVSGAFDGTISYSWLMQTNTVATYVNNLDSPEIVRYNSITATPITVSLDILSPSSSLTDSDVWLEVQYLSSNSSPISSFISDNTASVNGGNVLAIPVAQQSSTSTWINEPANSFKHILSVTFTPQMKGYIHAVVRLAKPSTTIYVDPKLTVV